MKINIISDTHLFFKKQVGGITSAVKHHTQILQKLGIKYSINQFNFKEDYDIIHSHTWLILPSIKRIFTKKPMVFSVHNILEEVYGTSALPNILIKSITNRVKKLWNSADLLVVPSEFTKEERRRFGLD